MLPTYLPARPDPNPMFLEKRVYQGSSGRVYPLPFTDRIAEKPIPRAWDAVWLENRWLRVMILPELGGRVHVAQDKTNGYDFIYRQRVIKPALVGLAGPWISGGIEFNWPQHHRPATFLPAAVEVERHADGSITVWLGDLDPLSRMKGLHGVCLHPDRACLELRVRAHNPTLLTQTFLWWANVAVRVHEGYQSFFPPDVRHVADHAKRAMSRFPLCQGSYYGVDYGKRGREGVPLSERPAQFQPPSLGRAQGSGPVPWYPPHDLSWYANIPVPTSYMALDSREDFFGGYDHFRQAGLVHIADHRVAPGKKQWTWGNHEFGYAWDRNLTDEDGPYIELMAGVYTDNQPDFSFLQPGETKTWSQYWYPIQRIGPAHHANLQAAVRLDVDRAAVRVGVSVTESFPKAEVRLEGGRRRRSWKVDLGPGRPFVAEMPQPTRPWPARGITLCVLARDGREILRFTPRRHKPTPIPEPAREPLPPQAVSTVEELYLIGLHLEQYRHATRDPVPYWREGLRRDPGDSRCHDALGQWHLRRAEWAEAADHFRAAIARLTLRNPNPMDGAPFYHLGVCLRHQLDARPGPAGEGDEAGLRLEEEACDALAKAAWNQAWAAPACHALAEMDCRRRRWDRALDHLDRVLRLDADHLGARDLKAMVLRRQGRLAEADALLRATRALDPLNWMTRYLLGNPLACGAQARLDMALQMARAGFYAEGIRLLKLKSAPDRRGPHALPTQDWGAAPLRHYYLAWLHEKLAQRRPALNECQRAAALSPDYCFPARLEEVAILRTAMGLNPRDARAPYYLGNLLYDRRRYEEAMALWDRSARLDPDYSVVWRNLGIGCFNVSHQPQKARLAYARARRAAPSDARLLYEQDQLWKRLGVAPARRLRELDRHSVLVQARDDLSLEYCALCNQTGQHERALRIMTTRRFQPWEGGEGQAWGQHVRTHLALGRQALAQGRLATARSCFEQALHCPAHLGEAKHLLANQSDVHYHLGLSLQALGEAKAARHHWSVAARFRGDFQEMRTRVFSETTYFSALAWGRLGRADRMRNLLRDLLAYARRLRRSQAGVDYFATSLPSMLLFEDDLQHRQETTVLYLEAQARLGLGQRSRARQLLEEVLCRDPSHAAAADLQETMTSPPQAKSSGRTGRTRAIHLEKQVCPR